MDSWASGLIPQKLRQGRKRLQICIAAIRSYCYYVFDRCCDDLLRMSPLLQLPTAKTKVCTIVRAASSSAASEPLGYLGKLVSVLPAIFHMLTTRSTDPSCMYKASTVSRPRPSKDPLFRPMYPLFLDHETPMKGTGRFLVIKTLPPVSISFFFSTGVISLHRKS